MKVLLATDGLFAAKEAQALLTRIADRKRTEITVMAVARGTLFFTEDMYPSVDLVEEERRYCKEVADKTRSDLEAAGFETDVRVGEGHPGEEIVKAVEGGGYDLTILGSGSRSWLGQHLLGSVSTYVLHSSPTSVMVVHETIDGREGCRVLVGVDGSTDALRAVGDLAALADPDRCEVEVFSVAHDPEIMTVVPPLGAGPVDPTINERLRREQEERAARYALDAASVLRDKGFRASDEIMVGHASQLLLKQAESGRFDLIVVGSRGLSRMKRAFLRSTSDHIARHAPAAFVSRQLDS